MGIFIAENVRGKTTVNYSKSLMSDEDVQFINNIIKKYVDIYDPEISFSLTVHLKDPEHVFLFG